MSALLGPAKACRALGLSFADEAAACGDDQNALLLTRMSAGFTKAAESLERQMVDESSGPPRPEYLPDGVGDGR
jgi:hypothetical protein